MKVAVEMNAKAMNAIIARENAKLNHAITYAETEVLPKVEVVADKGGHAVMLKKNRRIKWKYLRAELNKGDYKVANLLTHYIVAW